MRAGDRSVDEISLLRGVHVLIFAVFDCKAKIAKFKLHGDFAKRVLEMLWG